MFDRSPTSAAQAIIARHPNLRCLGGTQTESGGRVVLRRIFRAPALLDLTPDEMNQLDSCDPAVIVDFRGTAEASESPVVLPQRLSDRRLSIPIEPSATPRFQFLHEKDQPSQITHELVVEAMIETYRDFVRRHANSYAAFIRTIAAAAGRPVMFHCTAGKDRTGVAAALVLAALGAPREAIMRDFMATRDLWRPDARLKARLPETAHAGVYGLSETYLEAAFEEFDRLHGGPQAFVSDVLGGDAARRRWTALHLDLC